MPGLRSGTGRCVEGGKTGASFGCSGTPREARNSRHSLKGLAGVVHRIGPTVAGRVKWLDVHVGDRVKAGQILGEMDAVDLDERMRAQDAVLKRAEAALREAEARQAHAQTQARRYD